MARWCIMRVLNPTKTELATATRVRVAAWMKYEARKGMAPHVTAKAVYECANLGFSLG